MVDVTKLKKVQRSKGLGTPPGPEEIAVGLAASELAPSSQEIRDVSQQAVSLLAEAYVRRDGRSARKTNRTLPFATRVSAEFDMDIRDIADREGLKLVEVLERAIVAYKEKINF